MFIDRQAELAFLNRIQTRQRPGPAQLILLYGRRRVGKTRLLRHWAENRDDVVQFGYRFHPTRMTQHTEEEPPATFAFIVP